MPIIVEGVCPTLRTLRMSENISKLRGLRGLRPDGRVDGPSDLPLDHRLTFSPHSGEKWSFEGERKVFVNGADVAELVGEGANDVGLLCGLSEGLARYKHYVWERGGGSQARFNAVVSSLQGTISTRLDSIYDGVMSGVKFECSGKDFWINNVNVRSVLALYWHRPTEKARRYLAGIRDRLGLILASRRSNTRYDGIHERARELFDKISLAMEHIPPDAPYRLERSSRGS